MAREACRANETKERFEVDKFIEERVSHECARFIRERYGTPEHPYSTDACVALLERWLVANQSTRAQTLSNTSNNKVINAIGDGDSAPTGDSHSGFPSSRDGYPHAWDEVPLNRASRPELCVVYLFDDAPHRTDIKGFFTAAT